MRETIQPVSEAKQRALRYWQIDGIPSLFQGLMFLLLGQLFKTFHSADWRFGIGNTGLLILMLVLICLGLSERKIMEWAKVRITYPRTGYVNRPQKTDVNDPSLLHTVLFFVSLTVVFGLADSFPDHSHWIKGSFGLILFLFARMERKQRWSFGELISHLGLSAAWAAGWLLSQGGVGSVAFFAGVWLLVVGAVRLTVYLRRNPLASVPTE